MPSEKELGPKCPMCERFYAVGSHAERAIAAHRPAPPSSPTSDVDGCCQISEQEFQAAKHLNPLNVEGVPTYAALAERLKVAEGLVQETVKLLERSTHNRKHDECMWCVLMRKLDAFLSPPAPRDDGKGER